MAEGGLSRRRLMGIAAGTGLAAWAAPDRLAGAQTPAGESPKYGGVLTQGIFADPPHFDLHQSETITASCPGALLQPPDSTRPLRRRQAHPRLADRWDISKDGKVYTFLLGFLVCAVAVRRGSREAAPPGPPAPVSRMSPGSCACFPFLAIVPAIPASSVRAQS